MLIQVAAFLNLYSFFCNSIRTKSGIGASWWKQCFKCILTARQFFLSIASSMDEMCDFAFYPHLSKRITKTNLPHCWHYWTLYALCDLDIKRFYFIFISSWQSVRTISRHQMMAVCHVVVGMHDSQVNYVALLLNLPPVHKHWARNMCSVILCKPK